MTSRAWHTAAVRVRCCCHQSPRIILSCSSTAVVVSSYLNNLQSRAGPIQSSGRRVPLLTHGSHDLAVLSAAKYPSWRSRVAPARVLTPVQPRRWQQRAQVSTGPEGPRVRIARPRPVRSVLWAGCLLSPGLGPFVHNTGMVTISTPRAVMGTEQHAAESP